MTCFDPQFSSPLLSSPLLSSPLPFPLLSSPLLSSPLLSSPLLCSPPPPACASPSILCSGIKSVPDVSSSRPQRSTTTPGSLQTASANGRKPSNTGAATVTPYQTTGSLTTTRPCSSPGEHGNNRWRWLTREDGIFTAGETQSEKNGCQVWWLKCGVGENNSIIRAGMEAGQSGGAVGLSASCHCSFKAVTLLSPPCTVCVHECV